MFTMEITRLIEQCRQGDADALGEFPAAVNISICNAIIGLQVLILTAVGLQIRLSLKKGAGLPGNCCRSISRCPPRWTL